MLRSRALVQGSGCWVHGSWFRVQGAGFRVQGAGFTDQGSGCRVQICCSTSPTPGNAFSGLEPRRPRRTHKTVNARHKTVNARFWPWLEPFLRPKPWKTFKFSRGTDRTQEGALEPVVAAPRKHAGVHAQVASLDALHAGGLHARLPDRIPDLAVGW